MVFCMKCGVAEQIFFMCECRAYCRKCVLEKIPNLTYECQHCNVNLQFNTKDTIKRAFSFIWEDLKKSPLSYALFCFYLQMFFAMFYFLRYAHNYTSYSLP